MFGKQLSTSAPQCQNCAVRPFTIYLGNGEGRASEVLALRTGVKVISKKTIFFHEGDSFSEFYTVYDGWAICYGISGRGSRRIFDFIIPGDTINLSSLCMQGAHSTVEALTDMIVCTFRCADMDRYMHATQERGRHLEKAWIEEYISAKKKLMDWGTHSSTRRIARLILGLDQRLNQRGKVQNDSFHFPLRHQHIADALGMTQIHVNRIMISLRRQGIIEIKNQMLQIKEREELIALSM